MDANDEDLATMLHTRLSNQQAIGRKGNMSKVLHLRYVLRVIIVIIIISIIINTILNTVFYMELLRCSSATTLARRACAGRSYPFAVLLFNCFPFFLSFALKTLKGAPNIPAAPTLLHASPLPKR